VASRWPVAAQGDTWSPEDRNALLVPLAEELGVEPPGEDVDAWFRSRPVEVAIRAKVSKRATDDLDELLAELWAVHSGRGEAATPIAARIGPILASKWPSTAVRAGFEQQRNFDPDQLRGPDGRWIDEAISWSEFLDLYGEQVDEHEFMADGFVSVHDNGDINIHLGHDGDREDNVRVVADFGPDTARQLAQQIEEMASGTPEPNEASNGLVDWTIRDGYLVGRYPTGDLTFATGVDENDIEPNLADHESFDLSEEEARELVDGLRRMADEGQLIEEDTSRSTVPDEDDAVRSEGQKRSRALALLGVTRAAGHDVTPGNDRLHHHWTRGPGLAEWIGSDHQFYTLRDLLAEATDGKIPLETLSRWAASWVHEVTGNWPSSDAHRVAEGHQPRGHRIGPG